METLNNNQKAFLELVKAGLWSDGNLDLQIDGTTDWQEVYRLATGQSVLGLALAAIERYKNLNANLNLNQIVLLQWIGEVQLIEQRNMEMNAFVAELIEKLRKRDVYALLVKGQGVAQCYEKPLWRACGDVDLLLDDLNYEKAKKVLLPLAKEVETEYKSLKHLGMTMKDGFSVELHGMLHCRLSNRIDRVVDEAQRNVFHGNVRATVLEAPVQEFNGGTTVFLPGVDDDVIFIFTHILKHFYIEGIGLRQICDWCRLLYTYRDSLNYGLLEQRIKSAGLMSEWKAFGALAIEYLGMPAEAMPFLNSKFKIQNSRTHNQLKKKADRILEFVLETGNMGHNRERKRSKNFFVRKVLAAQFKMKDFIRHACIFPLDSMKFLFHYLIDGVRQARVQRR